jgi:hypothetical protein
LKLSEMVIGDVATDHKKRPCRYGCAEAAGPWEPAQADRRPPAVGRLLGGPCRGQTNPPICLTCLSCACV